MNVAPLAPSYVFEVWMARVPPIVTVRLVMSAESVGRVSE